jgi:protein-tyrosine phosphatase
LAEGIFRRLAEEAGLSAVLSADSCGTSSYHIGELPHALSREVARRHGIELTHRARQLSPSDFKRFDYLLAMDASNAKHIRQVSGAQQAAGKLSLMRRFDNEQSGSPVADPYGGDLGDFEECYQVLEESCRNLLAHIRQEKGL